MNAAPMGSSVPPASASATRSNSPRQATGDSPTTHTSGKPNRSSKPIVKA